MRTASEFWAWVDTHTDTEFYALYNSEPTVPAHVQTAMDNHCDYLIRAEASALYRAETNFGC